MIASMQMRIHALSTNKHRSFEGVVVGSLLVLSPCEGVVELLSQCKSFHFTFPHSALSADLYHRFYATAVWPLQAKKTSGYLVIDAW